MIGPPTDSARASGPRWVDCFSTSDPFGVMAQSESERILQDHLSALVESVV